MKKLASDIVKFGRPKKFFESTYRFNSLDLETINNELFFIGVIQNQNYKYTLGNFDKFFNDFLIDSAKNKTSILTWSKYDNTFIVKLLLKRFRAPKQEQILNMIEKVTPLVSYRYRGFMIEITQVVKMCIIFTLKDKDGIKKKVTIYNLKNLFPDSDLETTAKDYKLDYYSKMGEEYHIINFDRYYRDEAYRHKVIMSNMLDNKVIIDIAFKLLENFKTIAGVYPKTIFTAGSLARSYLLTLKTIHFNFRSLFSKLDESDYKRLLNYAMEAYHGGKIESYIIGSLLSAKIIDITAAYPYAQSILPKPTNKIIQSKDASLIKNYFYTFINATISVGDAKLIHPISIPSIINHANISPYGVFDAIITKPEYDYLLKRGVIVDVHDFIAVIHEDSYPYADMIKNLFNARMETKKTNPALSGLYKTILSSLYGITYELNDLYDDKTLDWKGYRAGDFFNPVIASYITAITRTYLSDVSQNILDNGGEVYLNMTDSIIYNGTVTLDVFSKVKTLGKFEPSEKIKDVMILGAGRYEYKKDFDDKYVIKSRGFSVKVKDKTFYRDLDFLDKVILKHKTFVTFFKANTEKYGFEKLGHLVEDSYEINPFNLGGKRLIDNQFIDVKTEYTTTRPVYFNQNDFDLFSEKDTKADKLKSSEVIQFKLKHNETCVMCGAEISKNEYAYKYKRDGAWHVRCLDHKPIYKNDYEPFAEGNNPELLELQY